MPKKAILSFISFVLILIGVITAVTPVFAQGSSLSLKEETVDGIPVTEGFVYGVPFVSDSYFKSEKKILLPFVSYKEHLYEAEFPYSDDYFRVTSGVFSKQLAQASLGLEISAFRNDAIEDLDDQYETYLKAAGFSAIYAFGYDSPTSADSLSGVIAHKKIDDFTLIACAPCGQGYGKEWGGNLQVGTNVRHEGFQSGAEIMEEQLAAYLNEQRISGKIKVWISGFSRAAAVANLTAADLVESGQYEDVYAYLFGVPRTTKEPVDYQGIYNICGKYDPVPQVPLNDWGFARYGHDLFTPAQETESDYSKLKVQASAIQRDIAGDSYRNNPEINHQIRLVLEFLGEMFPTPEEYADKMQDNVMKIWTEADPEQIITILTKVIGELNDLDQRQAYSSEIFLDYLSYLATQHLSGNRRQIEEGSWDQNALMAENFLREHQPLTYLNWLFSDSPQKNILGGEILTNVVILNGELDISVYQGETFLGSIDRKGRLVKANTRQDGQKDFLPEIPMIRNGSLTTLYIPTDAEYRIMIHSDTKQSIFFYSMIYSSVLDLSMDTTILTANLDKADYEITATSAGVLTELRSVQGDSIDLVKTDIDYSPTLIMALESNADFHLTPGFLIGFIMFLLLFLILLGLICLVVAIVHKKRKKKRGIPYSAWWVIVPHLLLIALFLGLTDFVVQYLVMIKTVVSVCAGITVFFIFLLSLRALVRKKNTVNLIITVILLVFLIVTFLLFGKNPFRVSDFENLVIFDVLCIVFTVLSVVGFFRKQHEKKELLTE